MLLGTHFLGAGFSFAPFSVFPPLGAVTVSAEVGFPNPFQGGGSVRLLPSGTLGHRGFTRFPSHILGFGSHLLPGVARSHSPRWGFSETVSPISRALGHG